MPAAAISTLVSRTGTAVADLNRGHASWARSSPKPTSRARAGNMVSTLTERFSGRQGEKQDSVTDSPGQQKEHPVPGLATGSIPGDRCRRGEQKGPRQEIHRHGAKVVVPGLRQRTGGKRSIRWRRRAAGALLSRDWRSLARPTIAPAGSSHASVAASQSRSPGPRNRRRSSRPRPVIDRKTTTANTGGSRPSKPRVSVASPRPGRTARCSPGRSSTSASNPGIDGQGRPEGQQHADLPGSALPEHLVAAHEHQGGEPGDPLREQPHSDREDQERRGDGGQGRGQPDGGLVESAQQEAHRADRPEVERLAPRCGGRR